MPNVDKSNDAWCNNEPSVSDTGSIVSVIDFADCEGSVRIVCCTYKCYLKRGVKRDNRRIIQKSERTIIYHCDLFIFSLKSETNTILTYSGYYVVCHRDYCPINAYYYGQTGMISYRNRLLKFYSAAGKSSADCILV